MPTHPLFILMLLLLVFVVTSFVLSPILNKDNRAKIGQKVDDFYDINKTNKNTNKTKGENE